MKHFFAAFFVAYLLLSQNLRADEGMWLFEDAPEAAIREKYGFQMPDDWLSDIQFASCRFGNRGSAAFVSPQGLIITNHHVGARDLHQLSTPENNLLEKGFTARTLADELKCPGTEVVVLKKVADITGELEELLADAASEDIAAQRGRLIAEFEQKGAERWGLRCEVVTLYQGGKYHLYGYKVYDDIRLVWAPEEKIAAFGGDPDNYEYPRFCLDACLFRAYENDKPAEIEHYLPWGTGGVADGELLFVSGFPGTTNRAYTKEHLEFMRDVYFPHRLQKLFRREVIYSAFAARSLENKQKIAGELAAVQNYRKRAIGQLDGLQTPSLWGDMPAVELEDKTSPGGKIREACSWAQVRYGAYDLLEGAEAFNSRAFQWARVLVRIAEESEKPNTDRLKEYREGRIESLLPSLLADTPVNLDVERLKLTDSLSLLQEYEQGRLWHLFESHAMGPNTLAAHARNKPTHGQNGFKSPKEWATTLIHGTKLYDVAERKRLVEGGTKAIEESNDPMIQFAVRVDQLARHYRSEYEKNVTDPMTEAYAELARRRFAEHGTDVYPDATFTLRLSYGAVKGYTEDDGTEIPPTTTIAGMFDRAASHKNIEPFDPPQSWKDAKDKLDPNTVFNFVTTNDIIGGNSGSPVINRAGEIVGLAFDGNIHSLSNNFVYSETQSRCVSVHVDAILESLKKIYGAERIVTELTVKK